MKKLICLIAVFVVMIPFDIYGQVSLSLSTDRERYIRFEPIEVTVSLKNYSGQNLYFDGTQRDGGGYLEFNITNTAGKRVLQINQDLEPARDLVLLPGATKSVTLIISTFFDLQSEDDYELRVRVGHRRFEHDFLSKPIRFQVRGGVEVWSRVVGLPNLMSRERIETRKCSLNTIHYDDGDRYFLRIEDDNYVYATLRLGPRVLGFTPQCEADALSRIHTLIQTAPRLLNYRIFDLTGDIKHNNYYVVEGSLPALSRDPDLGTVTVKGGRKAKEGVDFNVQDRVNSNTDDRPLGKTLQIK